MGCLASWSRSHVKDFFIWLGSQSHNREERGSCLQDVVAGQIFRSCTDRYARFEYLQTNFRPLSNRLERNTTVDQSLCQLSPTCLECVDAYGDWTRGIRCVEEGNALKRNMRVSFVTSIVYTPWNTPHPRKTDRQAFPQETCYSHNTSRCH